MELMDTFDSLVVAIENPSVTVILMTRGQRRGVAISFTAVELPVSVRLDVDPQQGVSGAAVDEHVRQTIGTISARRHVSTAARLVGRMATASAARSGRAMPDQPRSIPASASRDAHPCARS